MKKIISFFIFNLIFLSLGQCFTRSHFESPGCFIVDRQTGAYYVSNLSGGLEEKNGKGYISKISANGNVVIQKFIGAKIDEPVLNAPKGLLVLGKEIWAADIDTVKIFDKVSAKLLKSVSCAHFGAKYLNNMTVDYEGKVYVSDVLGDQILRINPAAGYEVTVFKKSKELGSPSGLVFNPKTRCLMVAAFRTGQILEIDRYNRVHILKKGLSGLNGIDYDSAGNLYVSSSDKGEIYRITYYGRGPLSVFQSGLTTPVNIFCDRAKNEILVTSIKANAVTTVNLSEKIRPKSA